MNRLPLDVATLAVESFPIAGPAPVEPQEAAVTIPCTSLDFKCTCTQVGCP